MRPRARLLRVDLTKCHWQFAALASQIQLQRFWLPDGSPADLLDVTMGIKGPGHWGGRCFAGDGHRPRGQGHAPGGRRPQQSVA